MKKASTLSAPIASLKFPPIVAISQSTGRAKDWDDIVTAHFDEGFARSWSLVNKKHGKHSLKFDTDQGRNGPPIGSVKVYNPVHVLELCSDQWAVRRPVRLCAFLRVETFVWQARRVGS